ncbi:MAG: DUF2442 domain-containing protein [Campylobacterales bacterium]|nr:DUF2442 domain-containing protein [Campylobacterales bacterium]
MYTSKTTIVKLSFEEKILVHLSSGDLLTIPYDYTERLKSADKEALGDYRLIGGGIGVHFEQIDEDISLRGIVQYKMSHELMAS